MFQGTRLFTIALFTTIAAVPVHAISVSLVSSANSPIRLGTMVRLTAQVQDNPGGAVWYRFRAREFGGSYTTIRDYGPLASLDWTTADHEGFFEVEVSVRNLVTADTAAASLSFQVLPLATGDQAAVTPTANPLVF